VFRAFESGTADLNGDGDVSDAVLQVYHPATGTLTNVGWSAEPAVDVFAGLVSFAVSESAQGGVDRNGDGDLADHVVALYDVATGWKKSTGLAAHHSRVVARRLAAIAVPESDQGATDLDGDGDANDLVLHFAESLGGRKRKEGHSIVAVTGRERWLTFLVPEEDVDLNGDGDLLDQVMHAVRCDV
jgi:hypothetical protein